MPRTFLWAILSCLLIIPVFPSLQAAEPPSKSRTLLVLGDSLSAAYGIPIEKGWVNLLEKKLVKTNPHWTVINASISGATTDNGLRQLPELLKKYQPKLVILELGGNDGLRGIPPSITESNLTKMIEWNEKQKAQTMLIQVDLPPNYGKAYRKRFQQTFAKLGKKHQLSLVSFTLPKSAALKRMIQADGLHPTAEAQPLLLQAVWKKLKLLK